MKQKIELLAPAGDKYSLLEAVESGCNAVYLGVESFNARDRAKNFKIEELQSISDYCHKHEVKVYLTLNTLIKNDELSDLIKLLYKLKYTNIDAIIFQDWGLFLLAKKLGFAALHASTQAGFHNSMGVNFANKQGIERTILARELTLDEIKEASKVGETEVFVHGALCYSLSGNCLFSSFLGGMSANRGKCKQPCRRVFNLTKRKKEHLFSLKDFQLIEYIPELISAGVASIKIEGRMKRAEYVQKVVSAYRQVIDDTSSISNSMSRLKDDYGRTKTSYFAGKDVSKAISEKPFAGIFLGDGEVIGNQLILIQENQVNVGDKIKIYQGEEDSQTYSVEDVQHEDINNASKIAKIKFNGNLKRYQGIQVYKVSSGDIAKRQIKFTSVNMKNISNKDVKSLLSVKSSCSKSDVLYIRVKSVQQINEIPRFKEKVHYIISIDNVYLNDNTLKRLKQKLFIELADFIGEKELLGVKDKIDKLKALGLVNFAISHVSQLELFEKSDNVLANEKVYTMNDFAIKQLKQFGVNDYIYPYENDYPNFNNYKQQDGIIAMFYTPALFTSRMPVKERSIKDRTNQYIIKRVGRLTQTYPVKAVCIFSFRNKLTNYRKFLIDISTPNVASYDLIDIFNKFKQNKNIENTSKFNVKKGLW